MQPSVVPVLIPAYQPSTSLVRLVERLHQFQIAPILVVNDGSDPSSDSVFDELRRIPSVTVLKHGCNLGKGAALKTGINYAWTTFPELTGVLTVDADGQHSPEDTLAIRDRFRKSPESLVLGVREFTDTKLVPLRSRFGNTVTRKVFHLVTGAALTDTQTGLRAIPQNLFSSLLRLTSNAYEFETDMLLLAIQKRVPFVQHGIRTVYIDGNASSHFNPLYDSLKIYFVLLRFALNGILTSGLDFATFAVTQAMGTSILASSSAGRVVSGTFNFIVSKRFVFRSNQSPVRELVRYVMLVAFLLFISNSAISALVRRLDMNVFLAKFLVDASLFLLSFSVQRTFIFGRSAVAESEKKTDWDSYYSKPFKAASATRKITVGRILDFLSPISPNLKDARCIELGGGNSCVYEPLRNAHLFQSYDILDTNEIGVRLFQERAKNPNDRGILGDILHPEKLAKIQAAKLCFSVGLIEHFDEKGTRDSIRSHFECTEPGGWVLMTYPTPTWLYRITRKIAELLGIWKFHDERPLTPKEVLGEVARYGKIIRHEIIWPIFLTQGIVLCQKN